VNAIMKSMGVGSICRLMVLLLSCLALTAGSAPAEAPVSQAQTKPSPLGRHYGFAPMEILKFNWDAGVPIAADVNGDGLNDLIVVNNTKARIDLLLQKPGFNPGDDIPPEILDGDVNDILGQERTWRFKRVSYDLDVAASALVVADLSGDGRKDLAFYAEDGLRVAIQEAPKPSAGPADQVLEPTWLPVRKFDVRAGLAKPGALAAGDLNGDGRTDLALLAADGTFVVYQKVDGTLGEPEKYHNGGRQPRQLNIADVNADGRMDLVLLTADQDFPVQIRYQDEAGRLGPELRYELPAPRAMELVAMGDSPAGVFASICAQSGRVMLSALAPEARQVDLPVLTYPLPATDSSDKRDIVAADVDGDGLTDVVVSDPSRAEMLLLRAGSKTPLLAPERFPGLVNMQKLAAGDLDGQGSEAIVVLSVEEKTIAVSRLKDGRLTYPASVPITGEPVAMDLGDVDGDGRCDLVYIAKTKEDGQGGYTLRTVLALGRKDAHDGPGLALKQLSDKPLDLRTADIDHDGRGDVMVLQPYGPILLVRQAEPGTFSEVTKVDVHSGLVANVSPSAMSLAPLGPNGSTAALLVKKNFARSVVFDAEAGWRVVDQYQGPTEQSSLSVAAVCRLPGQTDPAIVTYDTARGKLGILTRGPDGTYRSEREVSVGTVEPKKILHGDFGGGSKVSILLCGTRKLLLVPVTGRTDMLGKLASYEPDVEGIRYGAIDVGDVNGDGLPEVVLCDQGRHHIHILAFDADGSLVSASKFKVFEEPRSGERQHYGKASDQEAGQPTAVGIADVTGDGKNDLIVRVHDRIILYPQE